MRLVVALALLGALVGCSSGGAHGWQDASTEAASGCTVTTSCPEAGAPSYEKTIAPILEHACVGCHSATGAAGYPETSYAEVAGQAEPMLSQVSGCVMPPLSGPDNTAVPQLTATERLALTAWLVCGAPDN
jgi:hypothetical protein